MPPPLVKAALLEIVLSVTVRMPPLASPPPSALSYRRRCYS